MILTVIIMLNPVFASYVLFIYDRHGPSAVVEF